MRTYYVETAQLIPVRVTRRIGRDRVTVTEGVEFSIVPDGQRPGTWEPAIMDNGETCTLLDVALAGPYRIFVKVNSAVVSAGVIKVV